MSDPENTLLNDRQLQEIADKIEKAIIQKYKRLFIGVTSGFVLSFLTLSFFGIDYIKASLADSVANLITTTQFEENVTKNVTTAITELTQPTLHDIDSIRIRSKTLLDEIEELLEETKRNHMDTLDAASNEFRRTIDVLRTVRNNLRNTTNQSNTD